MKIILIDDNSKIENNEFLEWAEFSGNMYGTQKEYVKEKLEGKAEVFFPGENSRFVQYTLRYISIWAESLDTEKIDTVHWNNGIWGN